MGKPKLGVVFGGRSVEHEVSIVTGYQVIEAADATKYDVQPVYIGRDNVWYIGDGLAEISFFRQDHPPLNRLTRVYPVPDASRGKLVLTGAESSGFLKKPVEVTLDVVLPATHGTFGEDGSLQGLLEMAGVPYASSDVRGSAVGMDKELTKAALAAAGLPHLKYAVIHRREWDSSRNKALDRVTQTLPLPLFIKPAVLGSSVAVSRVGNLDELGTALDLAFRFGDRALLEPALDNAIEVNCSVIDGDPPIPSVIEQPLKNSALLTFDEKYKSGNKGSAKAGNKGTGGMTAQRRIIPAPLEPDLSLSIQDLAVKTFTAVGAGGVARVDFLISEAGEVYVNELNNIPGSLSCYLWEPLGKSFTQLIDRLIERAFEVNRRRNRTTFSFESNLLSCR